MSALTATELCARILSPPDSPETIATAGSPSASDDTLDPIYEHTIREFPTIKINRFRQWLSSLPLRFQDMSQCIQGRVLANKADTRLYFDNELVVACWPIILAMAAPPDHRDYDLRLVSESYVQCQDMCPDLMICQLRQTSTISETGREVRMSLSKPVLAIEATAPGVLASACRNLQINCDHTSDWDTLSKQIRRYAAFNDLRNVVIYDDKYVLYVQFDNPGDASAMCRSLIANTAAPGGILTARELVVFAAFEALIATGVIPRDWTQVPIPVADYADLFLKVPARPGRVAPPKLTPRGSDRQRRIPPKPTEMYLTRNAESRWPMCAIRSSHFSSPQRLEDSGYLGSNSREPKTLLVSYQIPFLEFDAIYEVTKRVFMSDHGVIEQDQPQTAALTSNLVVKTFGVEESIGLLFEATAYSKLFALQGNTIPFCYGLWDIADPQSRALVFERIIAPTIAEYLDGPDLGLEEIYALFMLVVQAVENLHASGYCHRDLNPQNVMVRDRPNQPQQVVLINLETARPVDEGGKLSDKASVSPIFRAAGVDVADLRNWWSRLEGTQ